MARLMLAVVFLALGVIFAKAELGAQSGDFTPIDEYDDEFYEPISTEIPTSEEETGEDSYSVNCPELTINKTNEQVQEQLRPMSCKDVKIQDQPYVVVYLYNGMEVLCDQQNNTGGWMVIQRRTNGDVEFYQKWDKYKYGFGDYSTNFWFGLEKLYQLTYKGRYELRVDMIYQNASYYAEYSHFRVLGSAENYKLEVEGYSGNAGDSLTYHNDKPFSTYDRDNDDDDENCAAWYHGAWWYKTCHHVNLNGKWGSKAFGEGVIWYSLSTHTDSLSSVEMKIRPY